jgi:outer membrane receptor protein involved in Fe transport
VKTHETKGLERLRNALVLSASVAAIGLGSAYAQDPVSIDERPDAETVTGDVITVTGSRIRRSELETTAPIFTLGEQTVEDRAFTNVADLLNQSPIFGGSLTPAGDQNGFTAGQNQVNLFDLGTQRTLTLVNGRRLVSSNASAAFVGTPGGQVDLNTIPVSMIDRVETVPLVGAATYGSDAIAGTVNVILKDDFEGFEVRGQYGEPFDINASSYQLATLVGTNFADGRGNVVFSAEYTKDEGILTCQRDYLCENDPNLVNVGARALDLNGDGQFDNLVNGATDIDGDGETDAIRLVYRDQVVQLFGPGGTASTAAVIPSFGVGAFPDGNIYQFDPAGNLEACEPGETPPGSSAFFAQGGTCGVDFFNNVEQLRSPVDRFNAFAAMNFDITDNVTFRQDFLMANTQGEELVNQGGFQTWAFGGTSAAISLDADNPFLTDQARGILDANGVDSFLLNRFNNDIVSSGSNSNETFVYRISNILEGQFEAMDRNFYWDVSASFSSADITTSTIGIVDGRFINAVDARQVDDELLEQVRLQDPDDATDDLASLDAAFDVLSEAASSSGEIARGDIICGAFADLAAGTLTGFNERATGFGVADEQLPFLEGCQPLNLFGQGAASAEAIAFINGGPQQSQNSNEQTVYQANFGGDAFELPAGMVAFNIGVESRREVTESVPSLGLVVPITRSASNGPISGKVTTNEVYGETLIPVVSPDMAIPFVNRLEFEGAVRYQEWELSADELQSETTSTVYSVSGTYAPVEQLRLRGTYATSFRNPNFVELLFPPTITFVDGADPCDNRFVGDGPSPDTRRANCQSIGIDTDTFVSNISNATISNGLNRGNPDLQPEEATSWTVGLVYDSQILPGFDLSVDYYNVEIEDQINFLDFADLAAVCFDSADFPNEEACDTFDRDASGQVTFASTTWANAAFSTFEAVTIRAFYEFDVADALGLARLSDAAQNDWGSISLDAFTQHNITNEFQATPGADVTEDVGDFADPKWNGTFDLAWDYSNFRFTYRTRWQNEVLIDAQGRNFYSVVNNPITVDGVNGFEVDIDNDTDPRFIHDISLRYDVSDRYSIQGNIQNLANRKPDTLQFAAGHFGIDERLGRRYTIRAVARF